MRWLQLQSVVLQVPLSKRHESGATHAAVALGFPFELDRVEDAIHELESWHDDDVSALGACLKDVKWWAVRGADERRFTSREIARIGGIVNFLCVLDGIARRAHTNLLAQLERMDAAAFAAFKAADATRVREIQDHMRPIRLFRNKVMAHTAYADPKPEDNHATQVTSLFLFNGMTVGERGITVGGVKIVTGDQQPIDLPHVSVDSLKPIVASVVAAWHDAAQQLLRELAAVPDAKWEAAWGVGTTVVQRPR